MKPKFTYYMTAEELQIIAAAGKMKNFLSFELYDDFDKFKGIQAVVRLVKDDFFVAEENSLKIGEKGAPFLKVFENSNTAVVARVFNKEAPPCCIYMGENTDEFVFITPHGNKDNFYKICVLNEESFFEELEELNFLPKYSLYLEKKEIRNGNSADCSEEELIDWENLSALESFKGEPLSVFEKYDILRGKCTDRAIIFCDPVEWKILKESSNQIPLEYCWENLYIWMRSE